MRRLLRRMLVLGVLALIGVAAYRTMTRRRGETAAAVPWSPLPVGTDDVATSTQPPRWVPANADGCPDGYPVKANDSSRIFHVPGGRSYARTNADRCYRSADDAVADGYRQAKA
jgi:hypothetical protein